MTTVIDTPEGINMFHLLSQYHALKLEGRGIRFKGGSVNAHVKRAYGFTGSRAKVLDQMAAKIQAIDPNWKATH
jgi:hypothetical protein